MSTITLWIQLENEPSPEKYTPNGLSATADLADFAALLCQDIEAFSKLKGRDLQFFTGGDHIPLLVDTLLTGVPNNSAENPLVIRYPLSSTPGIGHAPAYYWIVASPSARGLQKIRGVTTQNFTLFTIWDGDDIEDEFQLNAIVEETSPKQKKRETSLGIKIEGKKAYGEYTLKEVSRLFVKEEWNNIGNAPQFDIESLPQVEPQSEPTDTEYKYFIDSLKNWDSIFCGEIPNEATARCFISIFMGCAILVVQRYLSQCKQGYHPKDLRLLVEEMLSGSRGYGPIDYLVKYMQLVVMVNEA
ncbi:hypothetical protein BC938DRAFT_481811, partial [Jimgerdemannia flammicorona]